MKWRSSSAGKAHTGGNHMVLNMATIMVDQCLLTLRSTIWLASMPLAQHTDQEVPLDINLVIHLPVHEAMVSRSTILLHFLRPRYDHQLPPLGDLPDPA